jgi:TrmH family RNA methyltransferase
VALRVTTRNARFQQWEALLGNRNKRQRNGEFLVQGVRPITMAVEFGWKIREILINGDMKLSTWASETRDLVCATQAGTTRTGTTRTGNTQAGATQVAVAGHLMADLGGKTDTVPELLAVVEMPPDDLDRIQVGADMLAVLFDRPTTPGNIGTLIRSADAFGASGVIVTGHAADVYDPQTVRASTGSIFAVPAVRAASPRQVLDWVAATRKRGVGLQLAGTDEKGTIEAAEYDFSQPTLLLIGNETTGLSSVWRESADHLIRIPMAPKAASSLNAATAASVVLYESIRQRTRA